MDNFNKKHNISEKTLSIYDECDSLDVGINVGNFPNIVDWRLPNLLCPFITSEWVYFNFVLSTAEDLEERYSSDNIMYEAYIDSITERAYIVEGHNKEIKSIVGYTENYNSLLAALKRKTPILPVTNQLPLQAFMPVKMRHSEVEFAMSVESESTFNTFINFMDLMLYTNPSMKKVSIDEEQNARSEILELLEKEKHEFHNINHKIKYELKDPKIGSTDKDGYVMVKFLPANALIIEGHAFVCAFKKILSEYILLLDKNETGMRSLDVNRTLTNIISTIASAELDVGIIEKK